jgi:hypothetical protein
MTSYSPSKAASGAAPPDALARAADAPFGKAREIIRAFDPGFQREEGEKIVWRVDMRRKLTDTGHVLIEAASHEEAAKLVGAIDEDSVIEHEDAEPDGWGWEVVSIKPVGAVAQPAVASCPYTLSLDLS